MKKKLNKIFDEATPNELEQFSDALGAAEASDEELAAIKSKVYARLEIKKKKRAPAKIWLRAGIVAACVAVVMSFVLILSLWLDDSDTSYYETDHAPIIFDATVSPEQLNGNSVEFVIGTSTSVFGAQGASPNFQFDTSNIVVKARVVKNHPDEYYKLDISSSYSPTAYRLMQMETMKSIIGENVPQYFLYLIPEYVYVDMSVYDSLLISMTQIGTENYVLKNETQNQIESFDLPIFADRQDHPELGNIIAFSDGIFDESLWQNENWIYGYQFARRQLNNPKESDLVVARGDSERKVISAIKNQYKEWYVGKHQAPSVITLNFKTEAAKAAVEYVKPFANGVFSQKYEPYYGNGQLIFRRYINGCQTEETVTIDILTEEVTYSEVSYTQEDMAQIDNISAHLSKKAAEYAEQLPIPPHTDPEGKELLCLNLYAWYVKVEGKLYGVIKTAWRYKEKDNYYLQYYDDAYVLYDISAGTVIDISRDDLVNIVGTRNVYMGEYGKGIEVPK
ncbi:MAG: hypothetical protein J6L85_03385 [Clostridia bacterium]|nr:hypothetical protein [Clostridia bacterium]